MPTGYTAAIKDGIGFKEFAQRCARAFGAYVMVRDEALDAEVPQRFEPSRYDDEAADRESKRLGEIRAMSLAECDAAAEAEFRATLADKQRSMRESHDLRGKYLEMQVAAEGWVPPSPEHEGLKKFMLDQIAESIKWDCNDGDYYKPVLLTGREWRTKQIAYLVDSIDRHQKQQREENERTASRNRWIDQLHESLEAR